MTRNVWSGGKCNHSFDILIKPIPNSQAVNFFETFFPVTQPKFLLAKASTNRSKPDHFHISAARCKVNI